jgi:hypothetical protein
MSPFYHRREPLTLLYILRPHLDVPFKRLVPPFSLVIIAVSATVAISNSVPEPFSDSSLIPNPLSQLYRYLRPLNRCN